MSSFSRRSTLAILLAICSTPASAQAPDALDKVFIPDYSYAGYGFGEIQPDTEHWQRIDVAEHDILADDGIDDTRALNRLLESLQGDSTPVVLEFGAGRYEISDIIHVNRSHIVLRGAGAGERGSEFYMPRPLLYATQPPELNELTEYLVKLEKIQREKDRNIELPYSPWSWTGGFFWTGVRGERVKSYLAEYDTDDPNPVRLTEGKKGALSFEVDDADGLEAVSYTHLRAHETT